MQIGLHPASCARRNSGHIRDEFGALQYLRHQWIDLGSCDLIYIMSVILAKDSFAHFRPKMAKGGSCRKLPLILLFRCTSTRRGQNCRDNAASFGLISSNELLIAMQGFHLVTSQKFMNQPQQIVQKHTCQAQGVLFKNTLTWFDWIVYDDFSQE